MDKVEKFKELFLKEVSKNFHNLENIRFANAKKEFDYICVEYILDDWTNHCVNIFFKDIFETDEVYSNGKKICLGDYVKITNVTSNFLSYETVFLDIINCKFYFGSFCTGDYIELFTNHIFELIEEKNNE